MRYIYITLITGMCAASCAKESDVVNMLPVITTGAFTTNSRTSATLEGSVVLNGATAESIGIVYADDPNMTVKPQYLSVETAAGNATKGFTVNATNLTAGHTYYYRTFVHSTNQYYYGDYKMFTTPQMSAPTFDAFAVEDNAVGTSEIVLKARINDLGVESKSGVTLSNPSFKYKSVAHGTTPQSVTFNDTDAAWQTIPANYDPAQQTLTATATGLHSGTTYAICAYATTAGYGISNVVTITTNATTAPEVSAVKIEASESTGLDINLSANVTSTGTSPVTERGFIYSTTTEVPLYEGSTAIVADANFSCELKNLTNSTTYYIRAYARNDNGIGYGAVGEYTTPDVVITPTILTVTVNDIKSSTAVLVGYLDRKGLDTASAGFIVNGTRMPITISDDGTFYCSLTNLAPSTTYRYSTYCILSSGKEYNGEVRSFTTKASPADEEIIYPGISQ